jgi:MFS family permease
MVLIGALIGAGASGWRHTIIFLGASYLASIAGSYYESFVLLHLDDKFGGPRGTFGFSAAIACLVALACAVSFELALCAGSYRRTEILSVVVALTTGGFGILSILTLFICREFLGTVTNILILAIAAVGGLLISRLFPKRSELKEMEMNGT